MDISAKAFWYYFKEKLWRLYYVEYFKLGSM